MDCRAERLPAILRARARAQFYVGSFVFATRSGLYWSAAGFVFERSASSEAGIYSWGGGFSKIKAEVRRGVVNEYVLGSILVA